MNHLPNPAAARVESVEGNRVEFRFVDPLQADAFHAVVRKAQREGYAVEIRLVHYEGHPDMEAQRLAREARRRK